MIGGSDAVAVWQLTDAQLADQLRADQATRTALECRMAEVAAAAEQRQVARAEGFASTTAWLAAVTGLSRREAGSLVKLSRLAPGECAATRAAWADGLLGTSKIGVILGAIDALPDWLEQSERDAAEATLLDHAQVFAADDLRRLANRVVEVVDPIGADEIVGKQLEAQEKKAWARTHLRFTPAADGLTRVVAQIPNAQAAMLRTTLEAISSPRRPEPFDARFSFEQRMGHALCELIESLDPKRLPQAGGVNATVTVNVDLDSLQRSIGTATLSTGDQISAAQARRLACGAGIIPMVLGGASQPLDVGREKRLHTKAQRVALGKRDKGCCFPGCDRPPGWCQSHHLEPWSRGGRTTVDDGALFCTRHHHMLHEPDGWTARRSTEDGLVEVIPPVRVDPRQRPRRHARFTTVWTTAA